jgi:hypothetical protein
MADRSGFAARNQARTEPAPYETLLSVEPLCCLECRRPLRAHPPSVGPCCRAPLTAAKPHGVVEPSFYRQPTRSAPDHLGDVAGV